MNKKKNLNKKTKRQLKQKQKQKIKNKTKKYNKYKKLFTILRTPNNNVKNTRVNYQTKKNNKNNKIAIVLIYADWCGHCQALRPVWNEFINTLNKDKYNIIEINSDEQEQGINKIKSEYKVDDIRVEGYPTIGHIYQNNFYSYNGERNLDKLKSWVSEMKN